MSSYIITIYTCCHCHDTIRDTVQCSWLMSVCDGRCMTHCMTMTQIKRFVLACFWVLSQPAVSTSPLPGAHPGANAQVAQANCVGNQGSIVSLDATGIIIKVLSWVAIVVESDFRFRLLEWVESNYYHILFVIIESYMLMSLSILAGSSMSENCILNCVLYTHTHKLFAAYILLNSTSDDWDWCHSEFRISFGWDGFQLCRVTLWHLSILAILACRKGTNWPRARCSMCWYLWQMEHRQIHWSKSSRWNWVRGSGNQNWTNLPLLVTCTLLSSDSFWLTV